ncbi:MAG: dihydroorotate dehydrogenase [Gemmobacter sp.]|nr:dihydroorotate dehydrogenase [Gemmobacter sp.]
MTQAHDDLDDLFGAVAQRAPLPSDVLMARVMADAVAHQPGLVAVKRVPRAGLWDVILAALGGRGALAGLATATLAGVWIGFAQPLPVAALGLDLTGEVVQLFPDDESFFQNGTGVDGLFGTAEE